MAPSERGVAVVIDDDASIRELLGSVLERAGFAVVTAGDGTSGVDAVRRYHPTVVTMDLDLPGQDGVAVTQEVRRFSDAPIVVISGHESEIDVVQSMAAGADAFVVKPFRPRELRARIEALVRRTARQAAAGAPSSRPTDVSSGPGGPDTASPSTGAPVSDWVSQAFQEIAPVAEWRPEVTGHPAEPVWRRDDPPEHHRHDQPLWQPDVEPAGAPAGGDDWVAEAMAALGAPVEQARPPAPATAAYRRPSAPQEAGQRPPAAYDGPVRGLTLDHQRRLAVVDGVPVPVTTVQFDALAAILSSGDGVWRLRDLAAAVTRRPASEVSDIECARVDSEMWDLLHRLGESSAAPRWIEVVAGIGYRRLGPAR